MELNGYGAILFVGEEIERGKLKLGFSNNNNVKFLELDMEDVFVLSKHLSLVIDKYENDGVTIYDRVEAQIVIEEAKGGYIGTKISGSDIARVIDTYKKLGGV